MSELCLLSRLEPVGGTGPNTPAIRVPGMAYGGDLGSWVGSWSLASREGFPLGQGGNRRLMMGWAGWMPKARAAFEEAFAGHTNNRATWSKIGCQIASGATTATITQDVGVSPT